MNNKEILISFTLRKEWSYRKSFDREKLLFLVLFVSKNLNHGFNIEYPENNDGVTI